VPPQKKWSASFNDEKGKRHRRNFNSKAEAELWEAEGRAAAAAAKATKANKALSRVVAIQAAAETER
jgi:hypothetical protein